MLALALASILQRGSWRGVGVVSKKRTEALVSNRQVDPERKGRIHLEHTTSF